MKTFIIRVINSPEGTVQRKPWYDEYTVSAVTLKAAKNKAVKKFENGVSGVIGLACKDVREIDPENPPETLWNDPDYDVRDRLSTEYDYH
jgi:hypothetical protein